MYMTAYLTSSKKYAILWLKKDNDIWKTDKMQKLTTSYRCTPSDARCNYRNGESKFFISLHQKNLFLRHCAALPGDLLSVRLLCRTLALPGDWHRRIKPDFLNITFMDSGETSIRINDHSFLAETGDLILLPPGSDYEFGTNKKAVRSGIVVQGKIITDILQNLRGKYVFPAGEIEMLHSKIGRFFQNRQTDEHELAVWTFDLLSSLQNNTTGVVIPAILHKVIQQMQKNIAMPLKLEDLAADAGISPRTLNRMFTRHLQISPHKYLIKLRMHQACQMLKWEEFSVKETAFSVGYSNALNFSTEFKRVTGFSPSQYRMQTNRETQIADLLPVNASGDPASDIVT